jgi:hypothetical protein
VKRFTTGGKHFADDEEVETDVRSIDVGGGYVEKYFYFILFLFVACFLVVISSTLKIEALISFETSMNFYRSIRRYTSNDITLHIYRCYKPKSNICTLNYKTD